MTKRAMARPGCSGNIVATIDGRLQGAHHTGHEGKLDIVARELKTVNCTIPARIVLAD